jgi:hypothetical protein
VIFLKIKKLASASFFLVLYWSGANMNSIDKNLYGYSSILGCKRDTNHCYFCSRYENFNEIRPIPYITLFSRLNFFSLNAFVFKKSATILFLSDPDSGIRS